jgi:hypothetical protein
MDCLSVKLTIVFTKAGCQSTHERVIVYMPYPATSNLNAVFKLQMMYMMSFEYASVPHNNI